MAPGELPGSPGATGGACAGCTSIRAGVCLVYTVMSRSDDYADQRQTSTGTRNGSLAANTSLVAARPRPGPRLRFGCQVALRPPGDGSPWPPLGPAPALCLGCSWLARPYAYDQCRRNCQICLESVALSQASTAMSQKRIVVSGVYGVIVAIDALKSGTTSCMVRLTRTGCRGSGSNAPSGW